MATRECSAQTLLHDHIGGRVLDAIRADRIVDLGDGVHFFIGPKGTRRKLVVKLGADDLYAIERVRMDPDYTVASEAFEDGVYCDMLAERVLALGTVR